VAIWRQKSAAVWLIALSPVSAFGLVYQVVTRPTTGTSLAAFVAKLVEVLFIAAIPGFLGICMLQTGPRMEMTRGLEIPRE